MTKPLHLSIAEGVIVRGWGMNPRGTIQDQASVKKEKINKRALPLSTSWRTGRGWRQNFFHPSAILGINWEGEGISIYITFVSLLARRRLSQDIYLSMSLICSIPTTNHILDLFIGIGPILPGELSTRA